MKKSFIFTLLACCSALCMAQEYIYINKTDGTTEVIPMDEVDYFSFQPNVNKINTISLEDGSIGIGDYYIEATLTPMPAVIPAITWTSSDPEIVAVNATEGTKCFITGIKSGTAVITASLANGLMASCNITVSDPSISPYETFALTGYGVGFGSLDEIEGTDTSVELTNGLTVPVRLATTGLIAWADGISYVSPSITGAGEIVSADVYVYIITDGDYKGYYVTPRGGYFVGSGEPKFAMIKAGGITSAENYALGVMNLYTDNGDKTIYENAFIDGGATILHYENGFKFPYYAYVTEGTIDGENLENGGILYKNLKVSWFAGGTPYTAGEDIDAFLGLQFNNEGNIVEPIELVTITETYSNTESAEMAPRKAPAQNQYILVEPGKIDLHTLPAKRLNTSMPAIRKKN